MSIVIATFLSLAGPYAQAAETPEPVAAPAAGMVGTQAEEKKICRRSTTTNSRLTTARRCMTRAQWNRMDRVRSRDTMRDPERDGAQEVGR